MTSFKLDENLPVEATALFRAAGHDAVSVADQALAGHPDERVAAVCRDEGRVLVTLDLDFANVRVFPPQAHPGIVILRPRRADRSSVLSLLAEALPTLVTGMLAGALWIVEEHILRARLWREALLPDFAAYALWGCPAVLEQVAESVRGVTRPGYNTSLLEGIHLPVPPLDEQVRVVHRVEELLSIADGIERRLERATCQAEKLPQSILSKAFCGELVPTEAELARAEGRAYESAEELLARIAAGADAEAKPKGKRR